MKVTYNITQNKFNAILNQETTEIKVSFKTGYYPLPIGLENYYTKQEVDVKLLNYYTKVDINSQFSNYYTKNEVDTALATKQANLGYTPENVANKSDSYTASSSTTYASTKALVDGLATKLSKGTYTGTASDLVPYNGATQNVNIGAYYFESSQGFKKTGGTSNQALTADGNVFDLTTKADLVDGKVPSSQLPSYVDDVLEFANLASFPATGESGKIYIAIDTNVTYRWTGTGYAEISASLALGETASTAYRGDRGKISYDHSQTIGNPHGTTKGDIGLGNVPNADATNPANITQSASYRFVTDTEKATWNAKQNALTNPVTGTGTTNYLPKFTTSGTVGNSVIYDDGTNVGIGTTSPSSKLHITGTASYITITDTTYNRTSKIGYIDNANLYLDNDSNSNTYIGAYNGVFLAYGGGNVGIGTTSPSEKLEVNGNVLVQGLLKLKPQTSEPTGVEGAIYYNSTTKKHYGFDGTTWNALY